MQGTGARKNLYKPLLFTPEFPLQAWDPLPGAKWWRLGHRLGRQRGRGTMREGEGQDGPKQVSWRGKSI